MNNIWRTNIKHFMDWEKRTIVDTITSMIMTTITDITIMVILTYMERIVSIKILSESPCYLRPLLILFGMLLIFLFYSFVNLVIHKKHKCLHDRVTIILTVNPKKNNCCHVAFITLDISCLFVLWTTHNSFNTTISFTASISTTLNL